MPHLRRTWNFMGLKVVRAQRIALRPEARPEAVWDTCEWCWALVGRLGCRYYVDGEYVCRVCLEEKYPVLADAIGG